MATKNIVPNANGEGSIGTSAKRWGSAYFKDLNISGIVTGIGAGETISVKSKGATGDGITDDSASIQTALNLKGNIVFSGRPGTVYLIGTTLNILSDTRINIDKGVTIKATSALVGAVFSANAQDNVSICGGGKIDGSSATSGTYGVSYVSCTNSDVNGVRVINAKVNAIYINGTSSAYCDNISIANNDVVAAGNNGITFIYTKNIIIANNKVKNCNYGLTSGASTQINIIGNQFDHNVYDGLAVGDNCSYATVMGNTAHDNGAEGINIDGCRHTVVMGNTSYNNLIGITCWNRSPGNSLAGYNILANNIVHGCYLGIVLADSQPNCQVLDNNVRQCGSYYTLTQSGVGHYGIMVTNVTNPIISNNTVSECTQSGIYVSSIVGGAMIYNNYVNRNGYYGIQLKANTGLGRVKVVGNTVKENGDGATYNVGIYNAGSSYVDIENNYFIEDRTTGYTQTVAIYSRSTNSNVVRNSVYSNVGYSVNITGAAQKDNSWNYQANTPYSGTWQIGDVVMNSAPTAGGYAGWVCTASGTPGTWKGFGAIQA